MLNDDSATDIWRKLATDTAKTLSFCGLHCKQRNVFFFFMNAMGNWPGHEEKISQGNSERNVCPVILRNSMCETIFLFFLQNYPKFVWEIHCSRACRNVSDQTVSVYRKVLIQLNFFICQSHTIHFFIFYRINICILLQ